MLLWVSIGLLIGVVFWETRHRSSDPTRIDATTGSPDMGTADGDTSLGSASRLEPLEPEGDLRSEVRLITQVEGRGGIATGGATATWTTDDAAWNADSSWPFRAWDQLLSTSSVGQVTPEGELELSPPTGSQVSGSRLWITHQGFAAQCLEFAPGAVPTVPDRIELAPAPPVRALVVDRADRPVANATVWTVRDLHPVDQRVGSAASRIASAYLVRRVLTDASGAALLPSLGDSQLCWARFGDSGSPVLRADGTHTVRIEIGPLIEVSGSIVPDEPDVDLRHAEVSIYRTKGSGGDRIARCMTDERGVFGPIAVPVDRASRHQLQAQGPGFIPNSVEIEQPEQGGRVALEIRVSRGASVPMRVVELVGEEEPKPVSGAYVAALWDVGGRWEKARGLTDEDGYVSVGRLPLCAVSLETRASGFAPTHGTFTIQGDVTPYLEIPLERGRPVIGRVLDGEAPVPEFTIHIVASDVTNRSMQAFRGRSDGSFALDLPPGGAWTLFAVSEDRVQANAIVVDLRGDSPIESVILRVKPPLGAHGRVIDARTNEPVEGARIQAFTSMGQTSIAPFGPAVSTGPDGTFEVLGLAPGRGFLSVEHQRYAGTMEVCEVGEEKRNDFGIIPLSTGASVRIEVSDWSGEVSGAIECRLTGPSLVDPRRVPADGVLSFERLSPGSWTIELTLPGGRSVQQSLAIRSESAHVVRFDLSPEGALEVELVPAPGVVIPDGARVVARTVGSTTGGHSRSSFAFVPPSRLVRIETLGADRVHLTLCDSNWREIASSSIIEVRTAPRPIHFVIEQIELTTRLVDQDGEPLVNQRVLAVDLERGWSSYLATDGSGRLSTPPWPYGSCSLLVHRGHLGYGLVHGVTSRPLPAEIRCDFRSNLRLTVHDAGAAIAGAIVFLEDGVRGDLEVEYLPTDETGTVEFGPLVAGDYTVRVVHPSIWPKAERVRVATEITSATLDVRRRGSAHLVVSRAGTPIASSPVRILSEEFIADVAAWVAQGLVTSSTHTLTTDGDGSLRLDGLPRGRYRWETNGSDGGTTSGVFDVEPLQRVDVEITVP